MNWTGHNEKHLEKKRQFLRNNSTAAEAALWNLIKNRQLQGRKFRRQFSVGKYVLDFYCHEEKLCVELDGAGHFTEEGQIYDEERTVFLNEEGIRVIRIENKKAFDNTQQILDYIQSFFTKKG